MSSKVPVRTFGAIVRPNCLRSQSTVLSASSYAPIVGRHAFSSGAKNCNSEEGIPEGGFHKPRWQETPPLMKAPVRLRGKPQQPDFPVNSDPARLDQFYIRILGEGGDKVLSEETKWQAVTHKSFDQGRRGFNERLAFLGKQIVLLQSSLALLQEGSPSSKAATKDPYGRTPFQHPALETLDSLNSDLRETRMSKRKIAALARQYGLDDVLRWLPRKRDDFTESGIEVVLTQGMYAVIGGLALEKGGLFANEKARDCILKPLGFKFARS